MAINIVKKIEKSKNNGLNAGEKVVAATALNDVGAISQQAVGGGLGGLVGAFAKKKMESKVDEKYEDLPESELSKSFPTGQTLVGITDSRIIVYRMGVMSGKPEELLKEFSLGSMQVESFEKGKLAHRLVMSFKDGGKKAFDVPRLTDVDDFKNAL